MTAAEYLREVSARLDRGYPDDCVAHAGRIAELLLAEGRAPWIGRIRDVSRVGEHVFHGPLTPTRLRHVTWTTHYVACADHEVYDPLAGEPVGLGHYAQHVFGRPLEVEPCLDAVATARLLRTGQLMREIRISGAAGS